MIGGDVQQAAREDHDLIVIGGGIYGAMLALEAVRRGLRPLVLERDDFGAATSHQNLRIIHGGLRYLQSLDLQRFHESVAERRFFLSHFPDLVEPLPCLLPLYGEGSRRAPLLRAALGLNDLLSAHRNRGVRRDRQLPAGRVVGPDETRRLFPAVDARGLRGAALWHDGFAPDMPRIVIETLRWAGAHGATALNYVEVERLSRSAGAVTGVLARERSSGRALRFAARCVVNAAGPWAQRFASQATGRSVDGLFRPSLAWNLLLDRAAPSSLALGVAAREPGANTWFLVPWKGRLLVGTGHAPSSEARCDGVPSGEQLRAMLAELDRAAPALALREREVVRVFSGLLPCTREGGAELAARPVTIDHAADGARGFWSVSGVKFTTARRVASALLDRAWPRAKPLPHRALPRPAPTPVERHGFGFRPKPDDDSWLEGLRALARRESVQHLDDLVLRRTTLGDNPTRAREIAARLCAQLGWDAVRSERETRRLEAALERGLPRPRVAPQPDPGE